MNRKLVSYLSVFIIVMLGLQATDASESASQPVLFPKLKTPPIMLKASDVLPKDLLVGSNYRIEQTVTNDGFINSYKLSTDYGPLTVESTALLLMRINELKALQHMEKLKKSKVYTEALKKGAMAPLETAKGIVTEPVDTVKGVATGIGRWFSDVGRSITSHDPHQENVLKTAMGYAGTKRKFAYEYGIDSYTDFEPVQKMLGEIARAGVAGGLTTNVAFGAIKKPAGKVLKATGTANKMRQIVRDKSPAQLEKINKGKLKSMGVSDSLSKNILSNPYYNPLEKTLLVGYLESMRGIGGRNIFIAAASQANEKSVARFMRLRAEMMANYSANVAPVSRIVAINGTPLFQRKDGVIVGLFPLDYVLWTGSLYQKEKAASESVVKVRGGTGKELWIEGRIDPVARKALESRGWKVKDNVKEDL
jgi:hypothetical protein